jgi:hypothetical protein
MKKGGDEQPAIGVNKGVGVFLGEKKRPGLWLLSISRKLCPSPWKVGLRRAPLDPRFIFLKKKRNLLGLELAYGYALDPV